MAKYFIVAAHPDDEILGAGGTIYKLATQGHFVDVCFMCGDVTARANRPDDNQLNEDIQKSSKLLGIHKIYKGTFPNIEMNTVSHLKLVQFIESSIIESKPDVIITHHPSDTNNDHHQTSIAAQAAIRLFQRRNDVKPINEMWYMEVPSSTDWAIDPSVHKFNPNTFVEIGKEGIEQKINALKIYRGVMREYPHPRSVESLTGLAALRGSQSGLMYAEAFECAFRRIA